jgi:hypothetical protein
MINKDYRELEPKLVNNPRLIDFKKFRNISHCLFMVMKIQEMGQQSLKAARWLGWLLRDMEERGFLTNEQSRNLVRVDVQNGDE